MLSATVQSRARAVSSLPPSNLWTFGHSRVLQALTGSAKDDGLFISGCPAMVVHTFIPSWVSCPSRLTRPQDATSRRKNSTTSPSSVFSQTIFSQLFVAPALLSGQARCRSVRPSVQKFTRIEQIPGIQRPLDPPVQIIRPRIDRLRPPALLGQPDAVFAGDRSSHGQHTLK